MVQVRYICYGNLYQYVSHITTDFHVVQKVTHDEICMVYMSTYIFI